MRWYAIALAGVCLDAEGADRIVVKPVAFKRDSLEVAQEDARKLLFELFPKTFYRGQVYSVVVIPQE